MLDQLHNLSTRRLTQAAAAELLKVDPPKVSARSAADLPRIMVA
jgi:hypothetical protein